MNEDFNPEELAALIVCSDSEKLKRLRNKYYTAEQIAQAWKLLSSEEKENVHRIIKHNIIEKTIPVKIGDKVIHRDWHGEKVTSTVERVETKEVNAHPLTTDKKIIQFIYLDDGNFILSDDDDLIEIKDQSRDIIMQRDRASNNKKEKKQWERQSELSKKNLSLSH